MTITGLASILDCFAEYDIGDVLRSIAALQLIPGNADRQVRLEFLASVTASLPHVPGKPSLPRKVLERVANSRWLREAVGYAEDPLGGLFTEAFSFFGGAFVVFPGLFNDCTFSMQHLARALLQQRSQQWSDDLLYRAYTVISTCLTLSSQVAARASLRRNLPSGADAGERVIVPSQGRIDALKRASLFAAEDVRPGQTHSGDVRSVLQDLTTECGQVNLANYTSLERSPLNGRCLVHTANEYVIAVPGLLLDAARQAVLRLAHSGHVLPDLSRQFACSVWREVMSSLELLRHRPVSLRGVSGWVEGTCTDGLFSFDTDKCAHVTLMTNPLTRYSADSPYALWRPDAELALIAERNLLIEKELLDQRHVKELMHIILVEAIGGDVAADLAALMEPKSRTVLVMSAHELSVIALAELGDPLALWKYARCRGRTEERTRITSLGQLAPFATYRKNDHSFHVSDGRPVGRLWVTSDRERGLREEVTARYDIHPVLGPDGKYVEEVIAGTDARVSPVYVPLNARHGATVFLVEGYAVPIWFTVANDMTAGNSDFRWFMTSISNMVGHWLGEFVPSLSGALQDLEDLWESIRVELTFASPSEWENSDATSDATSEVTAEACGEGRHAVVCVELRPSLASRFRTSDNQAEREVMLEILQGIAQLTPLQDAESPISAFAKLVVDTHLPLSAKKRIFWIEKQRLPQLDDSGLPPFRKVQDADRCELLDLLGDQLFDSARVPVGDVAPDNRAGLLKTVVGFFYRELCTTISKLDVWDLLEWLVRGHEAIVRRDAYQALTLSSYKLCWGDTPKVETELRTALSEVAIAATSARFLIELVTAQPPLGSSMMSLGTYDRLAALAELIVRYGLDSDYLHFGLSSPVIRMTASGWLRSEDPNFATGMGKYTDAYMQEQYCSSSRTFNSYWSTRARASGKPPEVEMMDAAAVGEFGLSLTDIMCFLGDAASLGLEIGSGWCCLETREFARRMQRSLGWPEAKFSLALRGLSLTSRSGFLSPPEPFRAYDVYPWRFNRKLSYLRRPFLLVRDLGSQDAFEHVIWGPRHLLSAAENLHVLVTNGWLKADTAQMRMLMGTIHKEQGDEFNTYVYELCASVRGVVVRKKLRRVGHLSVPGDIDVLAANPQRHLLTVIECKDLMRSRVPHELAHHLEELVKPREGQKSEVEKLLERERWVRSNLAAVLGLLGLQSTEKWRVRPLVVLGRALALPYLKKLPVKVVSAQEMANAPSSFV